jgi:hypothetical protein
MPVFGPGTLKIGETGSEIDASCLINSARITMTKDQGDSQTKLCGTVKPGSTQYSYQFTGNIDVDTESGADGLFALSQEAAGTEQTYTFTPNTGDTTAATGTLIIDPLDFGADAYGDTMNSDFTWSLTGKPTYTYAVPAP